ncbi:Sperm motility kinase 3B [Paramyrothecium foliicola]|nr:Sperm motility kinase 3B [Paramyrothecium foliicola]
MTARLRWPFPSSLSTDAYLSRGAGGQVFFINDRIAFKCPTVFENPAPEQAKEMVESAERIAHEKEVYQILMANPHPYIMHCILQVPEGFFMERMATTLHDRIQQRPVPDGLQRRWILQLSSAVAWLESLGLAHGDLRPHNILLAADESIRLADFDVTIKIGEEVIAACEPFCKLGRQFKLPIAGPSTEQFALGTCIYVIRFGEIPMAELSPPERVQRLIRNELPPTPGDEVLGELIADCWSEKYESIASVHQHLQKLLGACVMPEPTEGAEGLLTECQHFLERER